SFEKTFPFLLPRQWSGVVPLLLATCDGKSPVKEITHVGQDVCWSPAFFSGAECRKTLRRVAQRLARAISQRCQGVPQKLAASIGCRGRCVGCHACEDTPRTVHESIPVRKG